jgi:hypothetical protein
MWVWDQSSGVLCHNGQVTARGYSGANAAKNNPLLQDAKGLGPIPRGVWRLTGIFHSTNTGPFTIGLQPEPGTDTCGRSAFRIHGDSIKHPGSASHGCIILPRAIRQLMWDSNDHILTVSE